MSSHVITRVPDVFSNLSDRLDYASGPALSAQGPWDTGPRTAAGPQARRLLRMLGVGRASKDPRHTLERASEPERWRLPSEDLLAGLHAERVPVVFRLRPVQAGTAIEIGVWSARHEPHPAELEQRLAALTGVLSETYAGAQVQAVTELDDVLPTPVGGMALGSPVSKAPLGSEYLSPMERIVPVVSGGDAAVTVLAYPVSSSHHAQTRNGLLAEMRAVQMAATSETVPGALAEAYLDVLSAGLKLFTEGASTGMWRTAAYLTGGSTYTRLAAAWISVYASGLTVFDSLRVQPFARAGRLASDWAMPDLAGEPAPGLYQRPFQLQSLLTSRQLAAYIHLPEQEVPGFSVTLLPAFDTVRVLSASNRSSTGRTLRVGGVLHRGRATGDPYPVALDDLSRHVLVCGVTGAGKTTTILWLLRQLEAANTPYLVVEPVKTEYRVLVTDHRPSTVRVFTAGNSAVLPLTLNPFEVPNKIPVSVHVDLLRALFTAAFAMWDPLPQILERCLHAVYADRGWDVGTGENTRLASEDDRRDSWPTLTDLYDKVEEVIGGLGYSGEITSNMRSALSTRIDGLRTGAKGAMLDTSTGTPGDVLFETSVVLELEALGADEDRAFVMGLLLIRLAEHRRARGPHRDLQHVLVLEEAHRLLSRSKQGEGQGDAKGKAVDAFVDMLAEIRAYGQGVVIADQVPVRLAPEVLKNTNLKIMQRTVAATDRSELAAASAMNDDQSQLLATLERGQAAVFSEGDDAPLLVKIGPANDNWLDSAAEAPFGDDVRRLSRHDPDQDAVPDEHGTHARGKQLGASGQWRAAVNRFAITACEDPRAALQHRDDLLDLLRPVLSGDDDDDAIAAAASEGARWLARRRGAQRGWPYPDERAFRLALHQALLAVAAPTDVYDEVGAVALVRSFGSVARPLQGRRSDPFPACSLVCPGPVGKSPPTSQRPCYYRDAASDALSGTPVSLAEGIRGNLVGSSDSANGWTAAAAGGLLLAGQQAGDLAPGTTARRAALCLSQQAHSQHEDLLPGRAREAVRQVIVASGLASLVQPQND